MEELLTWISYAVFTKRSASCSVKETQSNLSFFFLILQEGQSLVPEGWPTAPPYPGILLCFSEPFLCFFCTVSFHTISHYF